MAIGIVRHVVAQLERSEDLAGQGDGAMGDLLVVLLDRAGRDLTGREPEVLEVLLGIGARLDVGKIDENQDGTETRRQTRDSPLSAN